MRAYAIALTSLLFLSALIAAPNSLQAQGGAPAAALESPIGKVVSATGSVTVEHAAAVVVQARLSGGVGQLKTGDFVYRGDVVQTGADGKVGMTFTDGTAFNLSANARIVLNEFVYDPKGTSNSTLFSLTKGTFTFVAGNVAKTGDMKFDTPVATMGIRGTTPHVEISDDGTVRFSTLVEGGKGALATPTGPDNRRAAPRQRQGRAAAPVQQAERDRLNKLHNYDFKICRGC